MDSHEEQGTVNASDWQRARLINGHGTGKDLQTTKQRDEFAKHKIFRIKPVSLDYAGRGVIEMYTRRGCSPDKLYIIHPDDSPVYGEEFFVCEHEMLTD